MNRYALEIVFAERHADGAYESCRRTVYAFSETEAATALMEALSVEMVYPSHGQPFRNLKGRVEEISDHHRIRKSLTYESVQKGTKTAFVVSQDIFGIDLGEFDQFLALNETYVHLVELIQEGMIREEKAAGLIFYSVAS